MADKLWKSAERKIASLLGGQRVPITGRQRGSAPDIAHPTLSLEVKHRENFPAWLLEALDQAEQSMVSESQIPLAILHQKGMKYEDCLAVMRLSDLIKLMEEKHDSSL